MFFLTGHQGTEKGFNEQNKPVHNTGRAPGQCLNEQK